MSTSLLEWLKTKLKGCDVLLKPLEDGDWQLFLQNLKIFKNDKGFKKDMEHRGISMDDFSTLEHLAQHAPELLENPSRRDFLKSSTALAAGTALAYAMPRKASAEVIKPNVTYENYKQFVYSRGSCIVAYTFDSRNFGPDGDLFIKALEERLSNRIPIYKIDIGDWPLSARREWIANENGEDRVPSFHIIINNARQIRVRGPPTESERISYVDKFDKYLNSKGI